MAWYIHGVTLLPAMHLTPNQINVNSEARQGHRMWSRNLLRILKQTLTSASRLSVASSRSLKLFIIDVDEQKSRLLEEASLSANVCCFIFFNLVSFCRYSGFRVHIYVFY